MAMSPNALFGYFDRDPKYAKTLEMLKRMEKEHPEKFKGLLNQPERMQRWVDQIDSGKRTDADTAADIDEHIIAGATPKSESLEILEGKDMKWHYDKANDKWFVSYGLPNSSRRMVFEATPEDMDAMFGEGQRPPGYENISTKALLAQENNTYAGEIGEMEGEGSFEGEMDRVIALALDEGRLPEWAESSAEIMDILFIAQSESKSTEWTLQQISGTKEFKERFPGIETLRADGNLNLGEAVAGFLEYEAGVKAAMKASGQSGELVTPEMVGGLLEAGHSLETVNKTVAGFARMEAFAPALDAFNEVLKSQGFDPITDIDEMLEFVQGQASTELYDLWEASALTEASEAAGLGELFSAEDAMAAALSGNHTLESAVGAMQQAATLLLRMRHEVDTGKFGLDHEELIDLSLGQTPRSGRSTADIQDSINRAVNSAKGSLKSGAKTHKSFGKAGRPEAASLRAARTES